MYLTIFLFHRHCSWSHQGHSNHNGSFTIAPVLEGLWYVSCLVIGTLYSFVLTIAQPRIGNSSAYQITKPTIIWILDHAHLDKVKVRNGFECE